MGNQAAKKTIFLSHSTKDEALADALHTLLKSFINRFNLDFDVFYSPNSLKKFEKYSDEWKKEIEKAVKECDKFLLLWTPNSIQNRWVNYELGMAKATGKVIHATGTSGIDYNLIIPYEKQVLCIDDTGNDIESLLVLLFGINDRNAISKWLNTTVEHLFSMLKYHAQSKCVFISGSKPKRNRINDSLWNSDDVKLFVEDLTCRLVEKGFRLASYPTVPYVGSIVAKYVLNKAPNRYEIAGLYKFDDDIDSYATKNDIDTNEWNNLLASFRKLYLENKDCIVIIGGGRYTRNEYNVAKNQKKPQIFPIPCFGGAGKEIYEDMKLEKEFKERRHPCDVSKCEGKRINGKCPHIDEFVKRFEEHILINPNG